MGVGRAEPPVYRPFALLALGAALAGGVPLGTWLLVGLYAGGGSVPGAWLLLHAHLQIFGLFGALILGVAPHLVARFAGQPVEAKGAMRARFGGMAAALGLRVAATAAGWPAGLLGAALLEASVFAGFAAWLWRALVPAPLAATRRHLVLAAGWLVAALVLEAVLRGHAAEPGPRAMRAVHTMALLGGVVGFVLGVLLRAAPMFVAGWHVSPVLTAAAPWTLGLGVAVAALADLAGQGASRDVALAKLGEALALGTLAAVALVGGALRFRREGVPMLGRRGPEVQLFRLAMLSATVAALGSTGAVALAWRGVPLSLLADALRHLVTVGVLTPVVVAMGFRLIPVFEGAPLRWPRLRALAFGALLAAVLLRSAEVLADYGWEAILPWLPLSGVLVWVALACLAANLVGTLGPRWGGRASPASRV